MSDGAFHAFAGLLALSGLALAVEAVLGRGRRPISRAIDALGALGLLAGTAYVLRNDFLLEPTYFAGFVLPGLLLMRAWRQRRQARARRFAAGIFKQMYEAPPAPTPLTPFPPAPSPLGATPNEDEPPDSASPERHHRGTYEPRPSGLPHHHAAPPTAPAALSSPSSPSSPPESTPRGPMPSGLPNRENWPPPPPPSAGTPGHFAGYDQPARAGTPGHGAHERPPHAGPRPDRDPAGHDDRVGDVSPYETSTRLRQPAYLPGPDAPGSGRHRAPDATEPEPGADDDPPRRY